MTHHILHPPHRRDGAGAGRTPVVGVSHHAEAIRGETGHRAIGADAVRDAGLAFVGPPGDVHRRMGDKKALPLLERMLGSGAPEVRAFGAEQHDDLTLVLLEVLA